MKRAHTDFSLVKDISHNALLNSLMTCSGSNMGIMKSAPAATLHVGGSMCIDDGLAVNGLCIGGQGASRFHKDIDSSSADFKNLQERVEKLEEALKDLAGRHIQT